MREYGPRDKQARKSATFNGWLMLCIVAPLALLFGLNWFFESPSIGGFLLALGVPIAIAVCGVQAIRFGRGLF